MKYFLVILLLSTVIISAWSQSERPYIRSGNKAFYKASENPKKIDSLKYKDAEQEFKKALDEKPDSYEATYNLGNSFYKQQKFQDAITQYKIAANKNLPKQEKAWTYHNMGNSLLQSGNLKECIDAYKQALRVNPNDKETKYNLAYAQNMLNKQQQQQKQDQNQDKKDQQDKDKDQNKDKQDQKNQDKQEQQKQDQQKQDKQEQQEQKQKNDQISKEDAQRMLDALQNDEKKTQEKLKKQQQVRAQKIKIQKDW
ncbi:MAG TPA: hypothetical protein DEH02_14800 [Bacteroidales bacterium]|nr:hypothetical protein [Bacteroidales bacterium]